MRLAPVEAGRNIKSVAANKGCDYFDCTLYKIGHQ